MEAKNTQGMDTREDLRPVKVKHKILTWLYRRPNQIFRHYGSRATGVAPASPSQAQQ